MRLEARLKVGSDAYITLRGDGKALEKIDILHDVPLRQGFGGHPSLSNLQSEDRMACHPEALVFPERRVVEPIGIEPTTS